MSRIPPWFGRTFEVPLSDDLYPNLCARLRGTPARLDEMVRWASRDALVAKPKGKWSAQEHAGHLLALEPLWLARVEDFLTDGDTLTIADLSNRATDNARYNARSPEDLLADFRGARLRLVDRAEQVGSAGPARPKRHPRLGHPMRLVDHLYFVAEHDDHHLATIWETLGL